MQGKKDADIKMKSAFYRPVLTCFISLSISFSCFSPSLYASCDEITFHSKKQKLRKQARDRRATVGDEVDADDAALPKRNGRKGARSSSLLVPLHSHAKTSKSKSRVIGKRTLRGLHERTSILDLPDEILFHIASHVPPQDLLAMMNVCTQWRTILADFDFSVRASLRFEGKRENKGLFTRSDDGLITFIPSTPALLAKVKDVTFLGKYPGVHASERVQIQAQTRLQHALHQDLEALKWHRASRVMPLERLVAFLPGTKRLQSLSLTGGVLKSADLLKLLSMPCLSGLKHLDVSENCLDGGFLQGISALACRESLETFSLSFNHLGVDASIPSAEEEDTEVLREEHLEDEGHGAHLPMVGDPHAAASVRASPLFPRLWQLHLAGNEFSAASAQKCAAAFGSLPLLRELDVRRNHLGEAGILACLGLLPPEGRLHRLDARHTHVRDLTFLNHPACHTLEILRLDANSLEERVGNLGVARCVPFLKTLTLAQTQMNSFHLETLLGGSFPRLETLTLSSNPLVGRGELLRNCALLPSLRSLSLCHTGTDWDTIAILIKTRPLAFLDVRKNGPLPKARTFWEERMNPDLTLVPAISVPLPTTDLFPYNNTGADASVNALEESQDKRPLATHNSFSLLEELAS